MAKSAKQPWVHAWEISRDPDSALFTIDVTVRTQTEDGPWLYRDITTNLEEDDVPAARVAIVNAAFASVVAAGYTLP
jgi:hypothetical protein